MSTFQQFTKHPLENTLVAQRSATSSNDDDRRLQHPIQSVYNSNNASAVDHCGNVKQNTEERIIKLEENK